MSPALLMLIVVVLLAGMVQGVVIGLDLWPRAAVPLDGGRSWRNRRVFGDNKTVRGAVVMIGATTVVAAVLLPLVPPFAPAPWFGWAGLGALMGVAYIIAELPNSFVKRRLGIGPGQPSQGVAGTVQYVVDQSDSVIGVVVVLGVATDLSYNELAVIGAVGVAAHAAFDVGLHRVGVKGSPRGRSHRDPRG